MKIAHPLTLLLAVLLQGCVTHINNLPESKPLYQAIPIPGAEDDFMHKPSGYVFPRTISGFDRVGLLQYDTAGLDISAGYNVAVPTCPVVITIYVFPTPRMSFVGSPITVVRSTDARWLEAGYEHMKQEITHVHPAATVLKEYSDPKDGATAIYQFDELNSELHLFVIDHTWYLEYRETYPTACAPEARAAIQKFYAAWPGRLS